MILLDLICLLILGVLCYLVHYIAGVITSRKRRNKRKKSVSPGKTASKSQIKKDLDNLLAEYNQGMITEQQFFEKANPLIDKLSDLYSDVMWTYQS